MTVPVGSRRGAALALLLTVVVTGCGVPAEDTARKVEPPNGVPHVWATQTAPDPVPSAGAVAARLYLIRDGELVGVTRHVDAYPGVNELVDALLAGPTDAEQRDGLTSALLGNDFVVGIEVSDGRATVELTDTLDETGRNDQILAFAQIVCTIAAKPGVTAVSFTQAGQPVGIPRADGSLSESPATTADYASLISGHQPP